MSHAALALKNLDGLKAWPVKHRHWTFKVVEDKEHGLWVRTSHLRVLWPGFPSDKALQARRPMELLLDLSSKKLYLQTQAMGQELLECQGPERADVQKFLQWFQTDVQRVADLKRRRVEHQSRKQEQADDLLDEDDEGHESAKPASQLPWPWRIFSVLKKLFSGQYNLLLTTVILWFLLPWLLYLLSTRLLPPSLDWAVSHRRVAWGYAILAGAAYLVGLLYVFTLGSGFVRIWRADGRVVGAAIWCLLCLPMAWAIPKAFTHKEMVNYWWAGLRGKPPATSIYADPYLGRMVLRGSLDLGSAEALSAMLKANPDYKLLQLESPGGYVVEGMRMERLVREHKLDTVVLEECASACTVVYAGGAARYLGPQARMGFHRSGFEHTVVDLGWNEADRQMQKVWLDRGIDPRFTERALQEPIFRLWLAPRGDLLQSRFSTAMWMDRKAGY